MHLSTHNSVTTVKCLVGSGCKGVSEADVVWGITRNVFPWAPELDKDGNCGAFSITSAP